MFDICNNQDCTVDKLGHVDVQTFFCRRLSSEMLDQWKDIKDTIASIPLTQEEDDIWLVSSSIISNNHSKRVMAGYRASTVPVKQNSGLG